MTRLYGIYNSRAARTYWLAEELGIALEVIPVIQKNKLADPLAADAPLNTGTPDFLRTAPAGFIPTLEDDGLVLHESGAINLYLAKKHGGPLAPATLAEDAEMTMWTLYAMTSVEPPALEITFTYRGGDQDGPVGKAVIAGACEKLRRPLKVLDAHLAAHGHLVGDRFTVADVTMAECLRYAEFHRAIIDEFPALAAWYDRCHARPAFAAMMAKRAAE
ncbi:glutathione S-transferase family protein [Frigidibacter sp. MR17.14]|uniref:glutathione S-transferase family protein n=1 Tax=Frigidibacter sp. MR17.14 TaxID=3126509 RepID=UPI003012A2F9